MYATLTIAQVDGTIVDHYLKLLATPAGVAGVTAYLLLAALTLIVPRLWWGLIAVAIYVGSYGILRAYDRVPLTAPFSYIGPMAQVITAGLLALTLLATIRPAPLPRRRLHGGLFLALLAFQCTMAARNVVGGFEARGIGTLIVWAMMYVVFAAGVANWVYDREQLRKAIRVVAWAAGVMVAANTIQFVISPGAVFVSGRMYGTTPNPQRLGVYLAAALPFCVWCALEARGSGRLAYQILTGAAIAMLVATGSRTAMLMAAVSMVVFFRTQLGRAAAFAALAVLAVAGGSLVFGESIGLGLARVTEAGNSRSEIWGSLIDMFWANPVAGVALDYAAGESSYLSIAASYGLVGLVPAAVFIGMLSATAVRLLRARRVLGPEYARAADLVAGLVASLVLVTFVFEASLIGLLTDLMMIMYMGLVVAGFLLEKVAERQQAAVVEPTAAEPEAWDDAVPPDRRLVGEVG
jgi:hypothetical protein